MPPLMKPLAADITMKTYAAATPHARLDYLRATGRYAAVLQPAYVMNDVISAAAASIGQPLELPHTEVAFSDTTRLFVSAISH